MEDINKKTQTDKLSTKQPLFIDGVRDCLISRTNASIAMEYAKKYSSNVLIASEIAQHYFNGLERSNELDKLI